MYIENSCRDIVADVQKHNRESVEDQFQTSQQQ